MKKQIVSILIFALIYSIGFSLDVPKLSKRVNDYAKILSHSERSQLEKFLINATRKTDSQIGLLTIPSLEGENLEDFSIRVAEKWKLGQKGKDNGVIILVATKERKVRIEVGYGLEGSLTDLKASYIIRRVIAPQFKKGNYYKGVYDAFSTISGVIAGEYPINEKRLAGFQRTRRKSSKKGFPIGIIVIILFVIINSGKRSGRRGRFPWWLLLLSGDHSSGSSDSGGGFGGFGGGGASGGW